MLVGGNHPFFKQSRNPLEVIAHRGGGGEFPEETIYALEQAVKLGVDLLEIDIHKTCDDVLILMHDKKVDRTTNGKGKIKNLSYESNIKHLNAAILHRGMNLPVPRLKDVFDTFKNSDIRMVIEIKQKTPSLLVPFCQMIRDYKMTERVLVASKWDSVLREFRRLSPGVATSASPYEVLKFKLLNNLLRLNYRPNTDAIQWAAGRFFPITRKKLVDRAHQSNLKVHAWTVNHEARMRRMIKLGVDGIITDRPKKLLEILNRVNSK